MLTVPEPISDCLDDEVCVQPAQWDRTWPQTTAEFETFIDCFQDRLVRYAFRRTGCLMEAEDAVQEVFVKAYVRRAELASVTGVAPYLYRMTANLCTDRCRRPRLEMVPLGIPETESLADGRPGACEQAAAIEELKRVDDLLSRLPARQAEVLRLSVLDELTSTEIAEVIGSSAATVKSRLRYGLAKLRNILLNRRENRP